MTNSSKLNKKEIINECTNYIFEICENTPHRNASINGPLLFIAQLLVQQRSAVYDGSGIPGGGAKFGNIRKKSEKTWPNGKKIFGKIEKKIGTELGRK